MTESTFEHESFPTIDHTAPDLPPLIDIAGGYTGRGEPPSYDDDQGMSGWDNDWPNTAGGQPYRQSYSAFLLFAFRLTGLFVLRSRVLISLTDPPPSPSDHGSKSIAPFDSHSSTEVNSASSSIILPPPGQLLLTAPPSEDQDLQRAIYDSQNFPSHKGFVGGHRGLEQSNGDDDLEKALEMSMTMMSDAPGELSQHNTSSDVLLPQERVRDDLS